MCWDRHVPIGYDDAMTPFMKHRASLEDEFDGKHDVDETGGCPELTAYRPNVNDVVG